MKRSTTPRAVPVGVVVTLVSGLVLGLSGCAPEPGDALGPSEVAGQPSKGQDDAASESSWGQPTDGAPLPEKSTTLPESFPTDRFPPPASAEIDDSGERDDAWFVVLRASDAAAAESAWNEVVANGGFTVSDAGATPDGGRSATLTSEGLSVVAITIPQPDGTVLLSYDLTLLP